LIDAASCTVGIRKWERRVGLVPDSVVLDHHPPFPPKARTFMRCQQLSKTTGAGHGQ